MEKLNLKERLYTHLKRLCEEEKLSGTPGAEKGAKYIYQTLREMGVCARLYRFPAYLSDPETASLHVLAGKDWLDFPVRPRSFSYNCPDGAEGPLVFDRIGLHRDSLWEEKRFLETVAGKIVLAFGYDEKYARLLDLHRAAGLIQVWESDEEEIHEDTVGTIWGTPDAASFWSSLSMPVAAVSGPVGKCLIHMLEEGMPLTARLAVCVRNEIRDVLLPVAEIAGASPDFVLVSGHYDTWYVGAMDNGCANSMHLELSRELQAMSDRGELLRSVRIAFWPGHSNGRYMGSTWYMDRFFRELLDHCMVHINSDLNGSIQTDVLAVRTSGLEGEAFHRKVMDEAGLSDVPVRFGEPGRGADQSFWGARIPYHILARFEQSPEKKESAAPGPGVWWWHTRYDLMEYVDLDVLTKEYAYLSRLVYAFTAKRELPMEWEGFVKKQMGELERYMEGHVLKGELLGAWKAFSDTAVKGSGDSCPDGKHNRFLQAAGVLNELKYTYGSPYGQDAAFAYGSFPFLRMASVRKEECPEDWYLFIQTTIRRQVNRMVTELERLRGLFDRDVDSR